VCIQTSRSDRIVCIFEYVYTCIYTCVCVCVCARVCVRVCVREIVCVHLCIQFVCACIYTCSHYLHICIQQSTPSEPMLLKPRFSCSSAMSSVRDSKKNYVFLIRVFIQMNPCVCTHTLHTSPHPNTLTYTPTHTHTYTYAHAHAHMYTCKVYPKNLQSRCR